MKRENKVGVEGWNEKRRRAKIRNGKCKIGRWRKAKISSRDSTSREGGGEERQAL